ncbi:hypothetical protein HJC23_000661 [Cyclotella cryptica]|uniref:Uncharacterized protein n=1 Tax=Cyclotella cryptica TaxID=29204 RepID=A0ABD3Q7C9_9STRA
MSIQRTRSTRVLFAPVVVVVVVSTFSLLAASFQFPLLGHWNPLHRFPTSQQHHGHPRQPFALFAKRANKGTNNNNGNNDDDFTKDTSSRRFQGGMGFASSRNNFNSNNNGREPNISSIRDIDAALNDEIEGALQSAQMDLQDDPSKGQAAGSVSEDDSQGGDVEQANASDAVMGETTKLPKQKTNEEEDKVSASSNWDNFKETMYGAAENVKAKLNSPNFAADFKPTPPFETPGEKAMTQLTSIDVTSSSSSSEGDDSTATEDERMLLDAQREMDEAEEMLRQAEKEAARWDLEFAEMNASSSSTLLPLLEEEIEIEEDLSPPVTDVDDDDNTLTEEENEEDALTSMASAYQAALDAANDNVDLLSSQIEEFEAELTATMSKLDKAVEDKERSSAEYSYLASNYKEYKQQKDENVQSLQEEVSDYESKIVKLREDLANTKAELSQAQNEANQWKTNYESIQVEMKERLNSSFNEQQELQAALDDVTSTLETTLLESQQQYEMALDALSSEKEMAVSHSKKLILALKKVLRNTRAENRLLSMSSEEERARAVDDVRVKMNKEVEKLRGALSGLEGKLGEKEKMAEDAMKEREEREKLMGEIEMLKKSIQDEQSKLASRSDEYSITLEAYAKKEDELTKLIQSKDDSINKLAEQVEAMKDQIKSLESDGKSTTELMSVNSKLSQELDGVRSLLNDEKSLMASMEEKILSLEQELMTKQKLVMTTEKALNETKTNLSVNKAKFESEQKGIERLQAELNSAQAKLVDVQTSSKAAANEREIAAAKEKKELVAQIERLDAELKATKDSAVRGEQDIKMYEEKLQNVTEQLIQSQSNKEALGNALNDTRVKLTAANEQFMLEQKKGEKLQMDLKSAQAKLVEMELSAKSTASEREMAASKEKISLQSEIDKLTAQLNATTERALESEGKVKLYEERVQSMTGQLLQSGTNADKLKNELAKVRDQAQAALKKETDKNKQLQSQLEQLEKEMRDSLVKVDTEIKNRADALKSKEKLQAEMQMKIDRLMKETEDARSFATSKSEDVISLQKIVQKLQADLTKEAQLRDEMSKGKKGLESLLEQKVIDMQKEVDGVRVDAEKALRSKSDELKQMEAMITSLKSEVVRETKQKEEALSGKRSVEASFKAKVDELQKEIENISAKANATIASKNNELKKMEAIIEKLKTDVANENKLRDDALKSKAALEAALQKKMSDLQANVSSSSKNNEIMLQAKEKEILELKDLIGKLKSEIKREAELKNEVVMAKESAEFSLRSKIDQLRGDITSNRAKSEETLRFKDDELKKREAAVSNLKADLSKLLKVKDDAIKEKETLEKELTNQILQLKNTVGSTRAKADAIIARESKMKDDALKIQSELEAKIRQLEKDLSLTRAKSSDDLKQMDALVANLRTKINEKIQLETELQANIKQLQATSDAAVKAKTDELNQMKELASNLKTELKQQLLNANQKGTPQEATAASQVKAQSVAAPVLGSTKELSRNVSKGSTSNANAPKATSEAQSSAKSGLGFAKDSKRNKVDAPSLTDAPVRPTTIKHAQMKDPPSNSTDPKATSVSQRSAKSRLDFAEKDTTSSADVLVKPMTAEEAERARKARIVAAEEARKLAESKRVNLALDQLSTKSEPKPVSESEPNQATETVEDRTSAKVYVGTKPKYVRVTNEPAQRTASLKNLIKGKVGDAGNTFMNRKGAGAPSSQALLPLSKQVAQKGTSLKNVIVGKSLTPGNAFPKRNNPPAPSSQAPSPSSSKPDVDRGSLLKNVVMAKDSPSPAFPEKKTAPSPSSQAPSQSSKMSASNDHVREGLSLRRYTQTRKVSTSLGGLANTSSSKSTKDSAPEISDKIKKTEEVVVPLAKPASSSFANLSNLIGVKNDRSRDRRTVNQARSTSTKLGDIAKVDPDLGTRAQPEISMATGLKSTQVNEVESTKSYVDTSDQQEAFQRELLSSQLANKKRSAPVAQKTLSQSDSSKNPPSFSNLSAILQGSEKRPVAPTINRDRASASLFPEKSE